MAYGIGGKIEAKDYNSLINGGTTNPSVTPVIPAITIAAGLNAMWNDGTLPVNPNLSPPAPGRSYGYGQTPLTQVIGGAGSPTSTIRAGTLIPTTPLEWQQFYTSLFAVASHQNTTITLSPANARHVTVTGGTMPPTVNKIITWEQNINTILSTLANNRLNARQWGSTGFLTGSNPPSNGTYTAATGTLTSSSQWRDKITLTFNVKFANDASIRYFFNAGGQFRLSAYSPPDVSPSWPDRINDLISDICNDAGTVTVSSPGTGTPTSMAVSLPTPTTWRGVEQTQPAGAQAPDTINYGNGFYTIDSNGTTPTVLLIQRGTGYIGYQDSTKLTFSATYGGAGLISFVMEIDEVPPAPPGGPGLYVYAGTAFTMQIRYPSSTNIANTWGTPTIQSTSIVPIM